MSCPSHIPHVQYGLKKLGPLFQDRGICVLPFELTFPGPGSNQKLPAPGPKEHFALLMSSRKSQPRPGHDFTLNVPPHYSTHRWILPRPVTVWAVCCGWYSQLWHHQCCLPYSSSRICLVIAVTELAEAGWCFVFVFFFSRANSAPRS